MIQKAAPTSYSNKAMGSQAQGHKAAQPKQEEISKNPPINMSIHTLIFFLNNFYL